MTSSGKDDHAALEQCRGALSRAVAADAQKGRFRGFVSCSAILNFDGGVNSTLATVAANTHRVHTPTMTPKNAALLAFVGTILMTVLLVWNLVFTFLNVLRDLVPAVTLFSSFIYTFGCLSVTVFFFVFHRAQR